MRLKIFNPIQYTDGFGEELGSLEGKLKSTFGDKLIDTTDSDEFTPEQLAAQAKLREERANQEKQDKEKQDLENLEKEKNKSKNANLIDIEKEEDDELEDGKQQKSGDEENQHAVSYLVSKLGIDVESDEFKNTFGDLNLESDDIDDVSKFYELKSQLDKKSHVDEYLTKYPELKELASHLEEGRSLNTWKEKKESFNWMGFDIKEEDIETQEEVYSFYLKEKGLDDEEIKDTIEIAKDKKTLYNKSKAAQNALDSFEKNRLKEIFEKEQVQILAEKKVQEEQFNKVKSTIASKKLLGYELNDKEAKELESFVFSDQREKKYESLPLEAKILIDRIVQSYDEKEKKFNIKGFENKASVKKPIVIGNKKPDMNKQNEEPDKEAKTLGLKDISRMKPKFQTFGG